MAIGLVLANRHPIVLDALERLFRAEQDIEVLARCRTVEETVRAARDHHPDVTMLTLELGGLSGRDGSDRLGIVRQVKQENPAGRVVLLARALHEDDLLEAIRLGVAGVLLKEMEPHLFVQCVRKVHAGEQWLEKRSFGRALEQLLRREAGAREAAEVLTGREIEIVRMVAEDLGNKEIADRLCISEGTVKTHLHHIFEKLRIASRRDLTRYAESKGLISLRPR